MCLTSIATSAFCCAGEAFCNCICVPMKLIGVTAQNYSKLAYVCFQIFWILIAFTVVLGGSWILRVGPQAGLLCPNQSQEEGNTGACFSASGLVRMSWSLALFQIVILIVTIFKTDWAAVVHDGWWTVKFLLVVGLFISSFFIYNEPVMDYYLFGARYVSVMYLKYQAMHILVLAFIINNNLVKKANESDGISWAKILLVVLFLLISFGNLAWIIYMFIVFGYLHCPGNLTAMCLTLVSGVLMYGLVLFRTRPDASVFTSSLVFSYCLFLQWSAFTSDSKVECNPFNPLSNSGYNTYANSLLMMIIGLFYCFASLLVVAGVVHKEDENSMAT